MNLTRSAIVFIAVSTGSLLRSAARAGEPSSTTAPDKWRYTLFDPTPADLLRGMDTDRPNVTNTPHTVDSGHLQIESGAVDYSYYRLYAPGGGLREDDLGFGQFNFRLGVLNNLEVNAVVNAYGNDRAHDFTAGKTDHHDGFGDTVFGGKLNLWGDESGDHAWETALAIQPQFKFPTASDGVGNGKFEFSVVFPFLMNLPRGFHLGVQPGVSYERNSTNTGYVPGMQNSVSVDHVIFGNFDVYVEYASDVTSEKHVKAEQTIDVGYTLPLNDNVVIDSGVNFGLNDASTTIEVLAGISVRF
jgi:hypothetical protein